MRGRRPTAALVLSFCILTGCSGIGSRLSSIPDNAAGLGYVLVSRPVSLPKSAMTSDCGPESICAVMNFWGKSASVQELSLLVRDANVDGILTTRVGALARAKGLKAILLTGSVGHVKNAIDRDVPPIIMVDSGASNFHFFVVSGYNDRTQSLLCEDYDNAKRLIGYTEVEEPWARAGHYLLALEPSTANDDYEAGADREAKGKYSDAIALYKRALQADPNHYEALVGLGNCYLLARKAEEALAEYRKAYDINSADPKVCNNLSNALIELKRDAPEARRLAAAAVDHYRSEVERARADLERESQEGVRTIRRKELALKELDLADALGTLGQAHALAAEHIPAISAWKAALDHYPLTEFDARARRRLEIGISLRALSMPAEARTQLRSALEEARDPFLRERIEAALKE
jgi:tetratricopeptide (TPR) repeat protein